MAIYYCSFATGNDSTGTGTAALPWKTITTATTGRSAGDEIRVEKSPDPTALTGTVGFTLGSTAVTGVNTLFTTELAIGDFILAPDGQYYEVITLTSATAARLYKVYPSATQSGYSSYKLGITSTGAAAAGTTVIQEVSASGTAASFLYISGGWDLSNQQQTGQTYFRQIHSTFATRNGYGLYMTSKSFTHVSRLHFLRYYSGIYYGSGSNNNTLTTPTCNSNGTSGIYYNASSNNTLTSPTCNSNGTSGIYYNASSNNTLTTPTCDSNGYYGIYYGSGSNNNTLTTPTCNSNGTSGIYYSGSSNNTLTSPTCNSNNYGIYYASSAGNTTVGTLTTTGNVTAAICPVSGGYNFIANASIAESTKAAGFTNYSDGRVYINNMGGYSYVYTDNGNIVSQAATAGGTGKEWKFSPTDAIRNNTYPLTLSIARVAVAANALVTVTCYFKKSAITVAGALRCRYGQLAWSNAANDIVVNCPNDILRNQVTLQFTPTAAGVVEIEAMAWYVSATTESVIIDDVEITQS